MRMINDSILLTSQVLVSAETDTQLTIFKSSAENKQPALFNFLQRSNIKGDVRMRTAPLLSRTTLRFTFFITLFLACNAHAAAETKNVFFLSVNFSDSWSSSTPPTDPVSGSFSFVYDDTLSDGFHFLKPSTVSLIIDGVDYGIPANASNTNIRVELYNGDVLSVTFYFGALALYMGRHDFFFKSSPSTPRAK